MIMPNYNTFTRSGFEMKSFHRQPTTNSTRHSWANDCCRNCGIIRAKDIENAMFKTYYTDRYGKNLGRRVPECKPL